MITEQAAAVPLSGPALAGAVELAQPALSRAKRALDDLLALTALVLMAPVWALAALAVRLSSPGPVLYRQERVGLGGKTFTLLKLRTMTANCDQALHRAFVTSMIRSPSLDAPVDGMYKLTDDPRVTSVGRWLRKTSIDELPQLINVLRGEMSIVGPRPPLAYEVEAYAPWQLERLSARPGITGAWQVGGRNRLSYVEMCRLDIEYIRHWSLRNDLRIVVRTPLALLRVGGAA
jgi:lipopolysaccharide/colanic/teichoic acid biosynthesis glycosyltransferase